MRFETLLDKNDPRLYAFRSAVCLENGGSDLFLQEPYTNTMVQTALSGCTDANPEEVYKFGKKKWEQTNFSAIEAIFIEDQIVSISACSLFNERVLRVGMFLYTLKKYRTTIRDNVFSSDGFFARHINHAKETGKQAVFLSVYPYTKKLYAHALNLSKHKRTHAKTPQPYLKSLESVGKFTLNEVEQYVVGYRLQPEMSWPSLLPEFF